MTALVLTLIVQLLDFGVAHIVVIYLLHNLVLVLHLVVLAHVLHGVRLLGCVSLAILAGEDHRVFCLLACNFHCIQTGKSLALTLGLLREGYAFSGLHISY